MHPESDILGLVTGSHNRLSIRPFEFPFFSFFPFKTSPYFFYNEQQGHFATHLGYLCQQGASALGSYGSTPTSILQRWRVPCHANVLIQLYECCCRSRCQIQFTTLVSWYRFFLHVRIKLLWLLWTGSSRRQIPSRTSSASHYSGVDQRKTAGGISFTQTIDASTIFATNAFARTGAVVSRGRKKQHAANSVENKK